MIKLIQLSLLLVSLLTINAQSTLKEPRFEDLISDGFHGLVKENERTVVVSPRIKVVDAEVCAIELLPVYGQSNVRRSDIPFDVRIIDRAKGEAIIEALRPLNCEQRRLYKFEIRALACNGLRSQNASVILTVEDVNEYAPVFRQNSYSASVNEGKLYSSIIRLQASDQDCSAKYSEICKFEIIGGDNPVSPFTVDSAGNLANTRPLLASDSSNYILEIVAYDCGMKRSKPALVNIKVNKVCEPGWQSSSFSKSSQRIEYIPNSGTRVLFPDAELQLCDSVCEEVQNVSVKVQLAAGHIGKGCDRDTYSVQSQRKLCDAHTDGIDLLPNSQVEWTRNQLLEDQGHDDAIFLFKGSQQALYPASLKPVLSQNLSVSFWMQHSPPADHLHDKHIKEHVLCLADDHKKNRIHFAVFVRNCRLILLLRKEYTDEPKTIFRPAEWRWKLTEVCDNHWHHYAIFCHFGISGSYQKCIKIFFHFYAINVQFPDVQLYIDGQLYRNGINGQTVEIVDDWPLHRLPNVNTSLVIGACLAGSDGSYRHHFNGYLAGLSLINGAIEKEEVIRCMVQCKENIGLAADLNELDTLTIKTSENEYDKDQSDSNLNSRLGKIIKQMSSNSGNLQGVNEDDDNQMNIIQNQDGQQLLIEGRSIIQIEDAVSQIYYKNDREYPTPGRRNLKVSTNIKCKNNKEIKFPVVESYIMVLPPEQLSITLNGTSNLAREYDAFMQGIPLFSTVNLLINHEQQDDYRTDDMLTTVSIDDQQNQQQKSTIESDNDENLIDSDLNAENSEPEQDDDQQQTEDDNSQNNQASNKKQPRRKLLNTSKLDTCTVQVYPALNPEHEYFRVPVNYMNYLNVNYKQTQDGLIIYGIDTVHAYEQILREIVYFNRKPAYYLNRAFKLSCSELSGRFLSNDYIQTLTVIHPKVTTIGLSSSSESNDQTEQQTKQQKLNSSKHVKQSEMKLIGERMKQQAKQLAVNQKKKLIEKHLNENKKLNEIKNQPLNDDKLIAEEVKHQPPVQSRIVTHQHRVQIKEPKISNPEFMDSSLMEESLARAPASHAVTVIIVVCVSFLVFLIVLGVARIRASHNRSNIREEMGEDMLWNNEDLTITVNPLDKMNQILGNNNLNDDDGSDSSDGSSYTNGETSDEDDNDDLKANNIPQTRRREWDDSRMNF